MSQKHEWYWAKKTVKIGFLKLTSKHARSWIKALCSKTTTSETKFWRAGRKVDSEQNRPFKDILCKEKEKQKQQTQNQHKKGNQQKKRKNTKQGQG